MYVVDISLRYTTNQSGTTKGMTISRYCRFSFQTNVMIKGYSIIPVFKSHKSIERKQIRVTILNQGKHIN